jgi:DNA integrity scanning protein DisA with diadenylate cyclase activity
MISITGGLQSLYNSNMIEKTPLELERENRMLKQQIEELTNNWNELEEWVQSEYNRYFNDTENLVLSNVETMDYSRMLDKMKEIKGDDNEKDIL